MKKSIDSVKRPRVHRRPLAAVAAAAVLAVAGGTALAAGAIETNTPVVYNGCENVATGTIRLLPSSYPAPYDNTCYPSTAPKYLREIPISWNQVGPQGPAGAPGQAGIQGPT
jgi:hypothetical protein